MAVKVIRTHIVCKTSFPYIIELHVHAVVLRSGVCISTQRLDVMQIRSHAVQMDNSLRTIIKQTMYLDDS